MSASTSRARRVILTIFLLVSVLLIESGYPQTRDSAQDVSSALKKDLESLASRVEGLSSRGDVIATEVLTAVTVLFTIV